MKSIFDLKQERATLIAQSRAILDQFPGAVLPPEKADEQKRLDAALDAVQARIETEEKQIERERRLGEAVDTVKVPDSDKRQMFAAALSGEPGKVAAFQNAYDLGTSATAGYLTAPVEFVDELIRGLDDEVFMRQLSSMTPRLTKGQSLGFPYRKTAPTAATWVAEVTSVGEQTTLDFGRREFKPNKMAQLIKVSKALVEFAPMAESVVLNEVMYAIGLGQENAYMNGSGTNQPLGIFTASASGIDTGRDVSTDNTATTVTFDGLQNAKYSVKGQYHKGASWVMHRDMVKMLSKIKDGEGQYIWQGGVMAGQPDRLLGAPVFMSEYAPNTFTTGLYVAVFGDFKRGYKICDAKEVGIQVLKELYALTSQVGYIVDYFGDGMPVVAEAFARVKLG